MGARLGLALIALTVATAQVFGQELKTEELYKKVLPSVVTLTVEHKDGSRSLGTGFLAIKDGYVVTAWHVVNNAAKVSGKFSDGEVFEASGLIDKDEKRDVAVIRMKVFGRPMLPIQSTDPEVGSKVYVVGAPEGLEYSITDGIISQIQLIEGVRYYQYSSPTSHGNSGGPVINSKGLVVGVVSWGLTKGQNLNFAIPCNYVMGLDTSLPTTEWAAVKSTTPNPAKQTSEPTKDTPKDTLENKEFDKQIFDALETLVNGQTAISYTYDRVVTKRGGYRDGIPTELYARQKRLLMFKELLNDYRSADKVRDNYRATLEAQITIVSYGIRQLIDAIKTSQADDGWSDRASDMLRQSQATIRGLREKIFDQDRIAYALLDGVREACPTRLMQSLGYQADDPPFKLGVREFLDYNPCYLAVVDKEGMAEKMGLRSGDLLKEFEGTRITSIIHFKKLLKENEGKKVKVKLARDSKDKEVTLNVPADLSKGS